MDQQKFARKFAITHRSIHEINCNIFNNVQITHVLLFCGNISRVHSHEITNDVLNMVAKDCDYAIPSIEGWRGQALQLYSHGIRLADGESVTRTKQKITTQQK